jgi:hypothetical protein
MNYKNLFRFAQAAIISCTNIEKTGVIKSSDEYTTIFNALTPEEKVVATKFIGNVNGLRQELASKLVKRNNQKFYNRLEAQFQFDN